MMFKRKIKMFLITLLTGIMVFPVYANAYDDIDAAKTTSLTVSFQDDGKAVEGATFQIYQVASADEQAHYSLTGSFSKYDYSINDLSADEWTSLANILCDDVIKDEIACTGQGTTDSAGNVLFDGLSAGMYLVTGSYQSGSEKYVVQPYLIALPDYEDETWNYNVTSNPKYEKETITQTVSKTVLIVWDDEGFESNRHESVTVQLYRMKNGVYESAGDPVVLTEADNWTYTWYELDGSYTYTVVQSDVAPYTATKELTGDVDKFINRYREEIPASDGTAASKTDEQLPFTGIIWWPIPLVALAGLGFYLIGWKQKRDHE